MASGWRGEEEEEYIDMDLSSGSTREEFEFHMSAPLDRSGQPPLASPADELFYKGKLLPLHLPPRAQMVEDLLLLDAHGGRGRGRARALAVSTAPATPCERSPTGGGGGSCYALSGELNVEEFFREYYAAGNEDEDDGARSVCEGKKKAYYWPRKLRFVSLGGFLKLKAPKAYLKTMFAATTNKPAAGNAGGVLGATRGTAKELIPSSHGSLRAWRKPKNPFFSGQARGSIPEQSSVQGKVKEREHGHRRSFSSVIVRYSASSKTSPAPPSSSSSSSSSSVRSSSGSDGGGAGPGPALRRSSSASSEAENNPIQGLIAYCKKSQQLASVRKSASDAGFRFLSSKVAAESDGLHDDELVQICGSG